MPIEFNCGQCGKGLKVPDTLGGKKVRCPSCTTVQNVPAAGASTMPAAPVRQAWAPGAGSPPAPPPAPAPAIAGGLKLDVPPEPGRLPVTMIANKVVAGRMCPVCAQKIALGQPVHNCQGCGSSHHEDCWAERGGCGVEGCNASPRTAAAPMGTAMEGPSKPCPFCGEPIHLNAKKCRHCGEWVDPAMKKAEEAGESLTAGEWVFAILCSGIACIVAIVWMVQGNPKGKKLFVIALVSQIVLAVLRVLLSAASS